MTCTYNDHRAVLFQDKRNKTALIVDPLVILTWISSIRALKNVPPSMSRTIGVFYLSCKSAQETVHLGRLSMNNLAVGFAARALFFFAYQ